MLAAIHQPHYLPWIRYFEKIARSDVFIVLDDIQYSKNGWQNRNRIKGPKGPQLLTVPVHAGAGQRLDEIRIRNDGRWRKKHWKAIEQSYSKTPYFADHGPWLEQALRQEWTHLNALNRSLLDGFLEALGIETKVVYASDMSATGEATERLANLINEVGADAYYTGAYALETYLDRDLLEGRGIEIVVQDWRAQPYAQLHGDFVPDLAVVDVLMNCGPDALSAITGCANKISNGASPA